MIGRVFGPMAGSDSSWRWVTPLALLLVAVGCQRTRSGQAALDASVRATAVVGSDGAGTVRSASRDGGTGGASPSSHRGVAGPAWASWPIPSPPATGAAHPQDYDTSNHAVVLDRVTGRMWQRFVETKTYVWTEARDHCDGLDLGGFQDWRLPSRVELLSIVDLTHSQPSINQTAFPKAPSDWFWTSSVDAESPTAAAWYVYFYFGYPKTDATSNQFRVRCVRNSKPSEQSEPSAPSYDVHKEVVRDRGTGLTWQRATPTQSFSFDGARQYCSNLRLGHRRGWRVPSAGELLTLVDERRTNPTIDLEAFPNSSSQSFWTSTLFADSPAMAWHVYFEFGNALYGLLKGSYRVRCVQ